MNEDNVPGRTPHPKPRKYCGYCGSDREEPCSDGKTAMSCSKDLRNQNIRRATSVAKFNALAKSLDEASKKPYHGITPPPGPRHCTEVKPKAGGPGTPGYKADEGKPRMDLLPPELLWAVANVLTFGAKKYSDRNWEAGMKWGRVYAALQRHLWAWWHGEAKDPETGYSHLWHSGCCIAFLIAYEHREIGEDDRNKDTRV